VPVEYAYDLNMRSLDTIENDVGRDWKRTNIEAELGSPPSDARVSCEQPFQRGHDAKRELFRRVCPDALGVITPYIV
jgi:hypothetical protein